MKPEARQVEIYELIKAKKSIEVASLSEILGVCPMTIRRDLQQLEDSKLIKRSYGKAQIADGSKGEISFEQRQSMNVLPKQLIASYAIEFLQDNDIRSIYVDGSSTIVEFIKILPSHYPLTIFTNSFPIISLLQAKSWVRAFIIGGFLQHDTESFDDISSVDLCRQIFVDATFSSCSGLSASGMFNNGATSSEIRRIMQKNSKKNYILADHTKFNNQGIFLLNTWEKIDFLITDEKPEDVLLVAIEQQGVKLVWQKENNH
jgi:DeoR/GlpR family transcriptional regulator of sugar metabolism